MLEVSLLGVGTVLRLERDAWSLVKRLRQGTNEYPALRSYDLYRCGRTIGHLTVGDFAVMGVPLFLFAFLVSS